MIAIDHNDRNAYSELVSSSVQGILDLMAIEAPMKPVWSSTHTPPDADGMHNLWNNMVKRHIDGISDVPIAMFDAYSRIVQASDHAISAAVLNVGSGILKSIQHDYRNCATRMGATMLAPSRTLTGDQHVMISLGRVSEGESYHDTMNDILASYDNEHITKAVFDTFAIISDILSGASFNNIHMDTRYMIFNLFHAILTNPDDGIHNRSVYALITPTPEHSDIYQYFDHLIEQGYSMESIIRTLSSMRMMNAIIDDNEDTFRNLFTSMIDHHTIPYTSWMMGAFIALDSIQMEQTDDKISISINNDIRSKIMNVADIEPDTAMGFIKILELMESLETQSQRLADIVFHHRHDTLTYQALVRTAQGLNEGLPMSYLEEKFLMDTNGFSGES